MFAASQRTACEVIACWLACVWLGACAEDDLRAVVVTPSYAACAHTDCSQHGVCGVEADGSPTCACEPGYTTATCARCEAGFHRDAQGRCVSDVRCVQQPTDPCAPGGHCVDVEGVIACECELGYTGPRCNLCDARHARDPELGCLPLYIVVGSDGGAVFPDAHDAPGHDAAISDATAADATVADAAVADAMNVDASVAHDACVATATETIDFASASGFPRDSNTCVATDRLTLPHATFGSDQGNAGVRLCAPSSFNGMDTPHVELVASAQAAARVAFMAPVQRVQLDYASRLSPLAVSVWADQMAVGEIDVPSQSTGSLDLRFDPPARSLRFLGAGAFLQAISLNNLQVDYAGCP